jgi:hypothetical protein
MTRWWEDEGFISRREDTYTYPLALRRSARRLC